MTDLAEQFVGIAGKHGRYTKYYAKIGTHPGTIILVRRRRWFKVGLTIEFAEWSPNMPKSFAPKWDRGRIWQIENDRLFLELI